MTELAPSEQKLLGTRIDGIARQTMLIAGIDYTGLKLEADGSESRVTRTETLQRMTGHVMSCPQIGNVGHALLLGAGFKV